MTRKTKKPSKVTESIIQQLAFVYFRKMAKANPDYESIYAIPNQGTGGQEGMMHTQLMRAEGQSKGALDINVDVARMGFHGLRLELKKAKGEVSPQQFKWMMRHSNQGYYAVALFTDDPEDLVNFVDNYLEPPLMIA